ncbi:MAG: transketolase family protein [Gaiella sp.]
MRDRFVEVMTDALDHDPRVALVLADIGVSRFDESGLTARHPERVVNVGIREQLLISVTAGLALEGMRPVAHSYAPFLVERPCEQIKLDLGHQELGAVLVSIGASYDAAPEGRTHQAPADVALLGALPGWTIHVPGHPDEVGDLLRAALRSDDRVYIRLSEETNNEAHRDSALRALRTGSPGAPLVLAIGPTLDPVLEATVDLDVTVAYTATARPLAAHALRELVTGTDVVLVEPVLAGTSTAPVVAALDDRAVRLLALGVANTEVRRYGGGADHRRHHGLDAAGISEALQQFLVA